MPTPKKNVAYSFPIALIDTITGKFKANPTLAAGDFKVSIDGGDFENLATLPVVEPAGSIRVLVSLSQSEMNGDKITMTCIDASGDEWGDQLICIDNDAVNIDDVVRSTSPANTLNISASGVAESNVKELGGSATALATQAALYDGAVVRGTVGTVTGSGDFNVISSDLSSNDYDYDNMWLVLLTGSNKFIPRLIGIYTEDAGTKRVQFTGTGAAGAFPQTVTAGDTWMIISGSL
jgi:hypothetical protein